MHTLDTLFYDLKNIISTIVIKYDKKGRENETLESMRESDKYISAMTMKDSFNTYPKFNIEAIQAAGINNMELARQYAENKYSIPRDKREIIVAKQREYIINNYTEKNNYYRMLNGLPNLDDNDFVYLPEDICIKFGIEPSTPIHQLSREMIILLRSEGYLTDVLNQHTDKEYLNYLGDQQIDIVRARTANNFAILRMTKGISESFYEEFNDIYDQCREYFMTVIYVKEYSNRYDLYDNFIALMIMVMTIQRLIANMFKYGIDRDFYDLDSIKMMFDVYNVPFMEDVPMEYQKILLRNLNSLLRYKSTDKVLFDICSLLGYERVKIFKYFLIKEHKLDSNEKPLFVYKEIDNGDGTTTLVEDKEMMYNLYFQSVELNERNTALALSNNSQRIDYNQIILDDPYWWEDDDLKNFLLDSEFNYVETKYLNMNIIYKLTEMLFECMYVFRLVIDKKEELRYVDIELPKIIFDTKVNLFDAVILMCALICRKNNLRGNILHTPSKIMSVLGFDFNEDFAVIRQYIRDNSRYLDQKLLSFIEKMNITKPDDVNELYSNIKEFNDFVINKMAKSQNIKEYQAYKKLFTTLMVTTETEELFRKKNGVVATTFMEYLADSNPDLYSIALNMEDDKISESIDHIISKINELITSLRYLFIINDSNNIVLNAVIKLIRFFKSYTTDLLSMNIFYLMDSKYYNLIKLIHDIKYMEKTMGMYESLGLNYTDLIHSLRVRMPKIDSLEPFTRYLIQSRINIKDNIFSDQNGVNITDKIRIVYE